MAQTDEYRAFAELIRARDGLSARPRPASVQEALTRLFEAVHDAKSAAARGEPMTDSAAVVGSMAISLATCGGGLDPALLKKDSFRLLDASTDALRDGSARHAVMVGGRCYVMGAEVVADFDISDGSLAPAMQAVRDAIGELNGAGWPATSVILTEGSAVATSRSGRSSSAYRWGKP